MILSGPSILFLWNTFEFQLYSKEKNVGPETPPVENHCFRQMQEQEVIQIRSLGYFLFVPTPQDKNLRHFEVKTNQSGVL